MALTPSRLKNANASSRMRELDGLRGFAALAVMLFHLIALRSGSFSTPWALGCTGVDLFFMISGFVIFMTLERGMTLRQFIVNRFARLYPAYWAAILIICILAAIEGSATPIIPIIQNLTMLQHLMNSPDLSGAFWTLYVELQFYVCIAAIVFFNLSRHIISIGWITLAAIGSLLLLGTLAPSITIPIFYRLPLLAHANLFIAGILFYRLRGAMRKGDLLLLAACGLMALPLHYAGRFDAFTDLLPHMLCTAVFFLLFAAAITQKLRILSLPLFAWFGSISYSLYLVHANLGNFIMDHCSIVLMGESPGLFAAIAGCIAAAAVITFVVEKPARQVLTNLLGRSSSHNRNRLCKDNTQ